METVGRTLIAPPVPTTFASVPSGSVPSTLLMGSESRLALLIGESVTVTTATTPLLMALAFMPDAKQTNVPLPEPQLSVFPAAVSDGPAAALSEMTSVGEYVSIHCRDAGPLLLAFNERFSESELPFSADPEVKLKDGA